MAKLTLNDITGGYQTVDAYNANNALIEAAIENTVSRDGTTPNQMDADFDMNSYNLQNVSQLTAQTFILNGTVITSETTLSGGLDAPDVSFTPTNPAGPVTTLQDTLDDDYMRNDRNESLTGTFDVSGLFTSAVGLDVTTGDIDVLSGDVNVTGDITVSGTVDGVDLASVTVVPAEQTGHTRAGNVQYIRTGQGGYSAVHDFKPQTESTWETWGPTGSGADNIIPEMDAAIAAGAKIILFKVRLRAVQNHASTAVQVILFTAEGDASPSTANSLDYAAYLSIDTNAVGESAQVYWDIMVPVTDAGIFQMSWFENEANAPIIEGQYTGFISD